MTRTIEFTLAGLLTRSTIIAFPFPEQWLWWLQLLFR